MCKDVRILIIYRAKKILSRFYVILSMFKRACHKDISQRVCSCSNNHKVKVERKCLCHSSILISDKDPRDREVSRAVVTFFLLSKESPSIAEGWEKPEFHFYHYTILLLFTLHLKFLFLKKYCFKKRNNTGLDTFAMFHECRDENRFLNGSRNN